MESVKDTTQSKQKIVEEPLVKKQVEIHATSTQPMKPLVIDFEEEWDNFNKRLNIEEQIPKLQTQQQKTTQEITIEETVNTQEVEHIPVTPTSEIILRIEEIPPLDVFYSPQHKPVVKRQRKKRKLDSIAATTLENELMDVLWKDSPIDPVANRTRLS